MTKCDSQTKCVKLCEYMIVKILAVANDHGMPLICPCCVYTPRHQASLLTLGPLIVWTSYATALNYTLIRLNPAAADAQVGASASCHVITC